MVTIPQPVQDFLPGKMAWVATASLAGVPNVTPKGTLRVLDDRHVIFADLFSLKTRQNLEQNPRVAVTIIDPGSAKGYQLKGTAELLTSGPVYDEVAQQLKSSPKSLPPMHYLVQIAVDAVYDQSVGPDAGKKIA